MADVKKYGILAIVSICSSFAITSCGEDGGGSLIVTPAVESCNGEQCDSPECEGDECEEMACEGEECEEPGCEGDECNPVCDPECESWQECYGGECRDLGCSPGCESWQECVKGACKDKPCDPACVEGQECVQGICTPDLCGSVVCSENQACFKDVCHDKSEFCGDEICTSEQKCASNHCVEHDACDAQPCPDGMTCVLSQTGLAMCYAASCMDGDTVKDCGSGKVCVAGDCIEHAFEEAQSCDGGYLNSYGECVIPLKSITIMAGDIPVDSVDVMLQSTVKLTIKYDPENTTEKGVTWTTKNVTQNDDKKAVKEFLEISGTDKDEISMKSISYLAGDIDIAVASTAKPEITATAKALVKPYFPLRKGNVYDDWSTYRKKNMSCKYYNEYNFGIFNHDLYEKFVQPKMLKREENGKTVYYPTRASVVAAARFLSMQFPFNFPYHMEGIGSYPMRSHFVWSTTKEKSKSEVDNIRIFGLNLTGNVYNADYKKITTATPWACELSSGKKAGLECSGFVAWSLRNGRFNGGDWKTTMFAGTNYKNSSKVNATSSSFNVNNKLDDTIDKFAKLDKTNDYIKVKDIKDNQIHAGDLLWHGTYKKSDGSTGSGHVAIVVGVKRNSDNKVEYVYVSEASSYGNGMTRYTGLSKFKSSKWGESTKYYCYLIRMDNVYSYYQRKYNLDESTNTYDDFW